MSEQDHELEQDPDRNRNLSQVNVVSTTASEDVRARLTRVTGNQMRTAKLGRHRMGGYKENEVDALIERASRTIDELATSLERSRGELTVLRTEHEELQTRLEQAKTPTEIAGEMFVTAHRAIEQVQEAARAEAEQIVADARRVADQVLADAERRAQELEGRQRDAEAAIESARRETASVREQAKADGERLIAESLAESVRAKAEIEAETLRLNEEIADLRQVWAKVLSDALARIEGVNTEAVTAEVDGAPEPQPGTVLEPAGNGALAADHADVVVELRGRLGKGEADTGSATS